MNLERQRAARFILAVFGSGHKARCSLSGALS
jgi:hypothetical protein